MTKRLSLKFKQVTIFFTNRSILHINLLFLNQNCWKFKRFFVNLHRNCDMKSYK